MASNKKQNISPLTITLIIISLLLILFSCISPILFTEFNSEWDFTNTGQIGDTIGGIMNPFIGIAGVFSAFLAFYIQYVANKMQREQFIKSINNKFVEEKIGCYNLLQLLIEDIHEIIRDFDHRVSDFTAYIKDIESTPHAYIKLMRASLTKYKRPNSFDRIALFKGFRYLLPDNLKPMILFHQLYSSFDYLSEALERLYSAINYHETDIFQDKSSIKELLIRIEEECVIVCNKGVVSKRGASSNEYQILSWYIEQYRSLLSINKETDFKQLKTIIKQTSTKLNGCETQSWPPTLTNIHKELARVLIILNTIEQKTNQLVSELQEFLKHSQNEKSAINNLRCIVMTLEKAVSNVSEEQIRKEIFEDKA